jgi:type IV secretion/conjugal transfer VirB4 family ATPase
VISYQDLFTKPRREAHSYGDLLPWFGMVSPGLVLCQDGSLLAAFAVDGSDVEGKEDYYADQRIDILQTALRSLNDRCTLWSVQERRFVDGYVANQFENPVAAQIDREWEEACGRRRNARLTQRFFLTYNFPNKSEAFFEKLRAELEANDGRALSAVGSVLRRRFSEKGAVAQVRGQLAEMAHEFEKVVASFANVLSTGLGFNRLEGAEFLGELYARANVASPRGPVRQPQSLAYLNTMLAADSIERQHDLLRFQGVSQERYVAALSMEGTPLEAHSRQVDQLMGLDCEYVLVQTFRVVDRLVAEKEIQKREQFYRTEVKSVLTRVAERVFNTESDKVNTGNLHLAQDAQDALVELTVGDLAYGYYNMTVLALGDTPRTANGAIDLVASSLRANGFTVIRERHGLMSALLTTFPGNANATLRWKLASTANLADLAPIRTISRGERIHPLISRDFGYDVPPLCRFLTPWGVTYDWNPHEGDLGHTAIVGGSGAGKTSLMTLLLSQFTKYRPSQAFIFDKDHSLMMATVLLGGKHIDMGRGQQVRAMNPVRTMLRNGDDEELRQWIEVLISADGHEVTGTEATSINAAIQYLRQQHEDHWRLRGLYALIAGQNAELAAKFSAYVDRSGDEDFGQSGSHAAYFDNDEDSLTLSSIVGLECGGLLDDKKVATPFMQYAFYCINKTLDGKTPTFIFAEEAWYLLSNPVFAAKMEDWLRTFRKKRAFLMFATQGLDELARLPNLGSFITNIPTQILLPSMKSSVREQSDLYRDVFGINEAQMQLLAQAIPKRDYLLVRPNTTRLVNTQMPSTLIAINEATTQEAKRELVLQYAAHGGPGWEVRFLREVLGLKV